ncbi:MAG TPA: hypothetical protein VK654_05295 [Nitrospirota bacterium]|nr:hypothetical protein [Nitrospirota bacterium]
MRKKWFPSVPQVPWRMKPYAVNNLFIAQFIAFGKVQRKKGLQAGVSINVPFSFC